MTILSRRHVMRAGGIFGLAAAFPAASRGAAMPPPLVDGLSEMSRFLGNWSGEGEGDPGKSKVARRYTAALGGKFIEVRNTSTYAPQEKNPKGEVHDDVGYLSFDKARKRHVLRQFHVEGFVNQYVGATEKFDGGKFVFESEALENIPVGFRARETYIFSNADAFEEVFEIAEPGKAFETYSHNRLRREA